MDFRINPLPASLRSKAIRQEFRAGFLLESLGEPGSPVPFYVIGGSLALALQPFSLLFQPRLPRAVGLAPFIVVGLSGQFLFLLFQAPVIHPNTGRGHAHS